MRIYEKVRAYINDNHLKQKSIARKAGISASTFSAMLHGRRTMYAEDLRAICYSLKVSANTFIDVNASEDQR